MLEVKIYCIKSHKDYQTTYEVIENVLIENNIEYNITRITKSDLIQHRNISQMPYIVINNIVAHKGSCPSPHDIKIFLIRTKLI
jgi:glutaredoxin